MDVSAADPGAVERALITYYDQEAVERAGRPLEEGRVEARARFLDLFGPDTAGRRVLEIGPGAGRDSAALVHHGIQLVGLDLSTAQLIQARHAGLSDVAVGSVRQLPFADESFVGLWTMSTLMHVPNAAIGDALSEIRRVLAPGAMAAIGVWGGPDVEDFGDKGGPRLFSRRSDARWQELLATVGSVEHFERWHPGADDFWYQWAIVRCT